MAVLLYSYLDTGAPSLSGTEDSFSVLRKVLLAVLVNGYGTKPAAGWSVGHDVAGGISLSNGHGFVNFVRERPDNVQVYIMEELTDGSTPLAGGVNRRSNSWFDGATTSLRANMFNAGSGSSSIWDWVVIADDRTAYVTLNRTSGAGSYPSHIAFGQYKNAHGLTGVGCFGAFGGAPSTSSYSGLGSATDANRFTSMVLRNPWTGLIGQGSAPSYNFVTPSFSGSAAGSVFKHKHYYGDLSLQRVALCGFGDGLTGSTVAFSEVAGFARGLLTDPVLDSMATQTLAETLGLDASRTLAQIRAEQFMLNGKPCAIFSAGWSNTRTILASLDEGDW